MTSQTADFRVEKAAENHLNFILHSWLNSYYHDSPVGKIHRKSVMMTSLEPILKAILERSTTYVAVDPEDSDILYGFATAEPLSPAGPILHMIYVKQDFRRFGIARRLVGELSLPQDLRGVQITHPTNIWLNSLARKFPDACVNLYLL